MRNVSSAAKTLSLVDEPMRNLSKNSEGYKRLLAKVTVFLTISYVLQGEMRLGIWERVKGATTRDIGFAQGQTIPGSGRALGLCDFAL